MFSQPVTLHHTVRPRIAHEVRCSHQFYQFVHPIFSEWPHPQSFWTMGFEGTHFQSLQHYGDCDWDRGPRGSPGSRRCPGGDQGPRRLNRKFNHTIYPLVIKCGTIQTSIYGGFPMAMLFPEGYNQQVICQSKCDKISKDTNLVKNAPGRKPLQTPNFLPWRMV
jgi:hypothetical protein